MQKGLNFRSIESKTEYFKAYDESILLINCDYVETYITTSYGNSHILCCGDENNKPLVLLHAASCGSPMWYKNLDVWSKEYCVYAIDLIGECSKSILLKPLKNNKDNAQWLDETIRRLMLDRIVLCGLSIGGWTAANYAGYYPERLEKLILLSPVQTFAKMHYSYFFKIMKMGFKPTRENIEKYIGWGNKKEAPLPDSMIKQFTLSVMNMNSNMSFPKWIKKKHLRKIEIPVLVMFGENEFAFSVNKAIHNANLVIKNIEVEVVQDASHLLPLSKAEYMNQKIVDFIK
ncbi:alpha/beta fold hydrolase [Anaerorhabdus sp.]|uniref:alpha/beta fold hydrolase n=1 Tax=Anaerorhabdus sp. TaxID=1872524 RepID=UPI002FCC15D3